jgi:ribosome-associated translation inhibitor RaiA
MIDECDGPVGQDEKLFDEFLTTAMYEHDPSKAVAALRCMTALESHQLNLIADLVDGGARPRRMFARKIVFKKRGGAGRPISKLNIKLNMKFGNLTELLLAFGAKDAEKFAHELRKLKTINGPQLLLFSELFENSKSPANDFVWRLSFERHRAGFSGEGPETHNFGMTGIVRRAILQSEGKKDSAVAAIQEEVRKINKRNAKLKKKKPESAILSRARRIGESQSAARRLYKRYSSIMPKK